MTIQIRVEPVADIIETELYPLLQAHRDELATNKALMVLAPDVERYGMLEAASAFFVLVARDEAGQIIGYSGNFIGSHLHYKALSYVQNDVLFLSKAHRKSALGMRLIRETELEAKARGAQLMLWHAKPNTALESLMPYLGYGVQDIVFSKEL